MLQKIRHFFAEYQIIRGMVSYAVLWPTGSLVEQTLVEKRNWRTYDFNKCLRLEPTIFISYKYLQWFGEKILSNVWFLKIIRFSIYGATIMGPAMFWWVRFAAKIFPRQGFRTALSKALSEQISVDPSCIVTFLFVMSLLERKTIVEAKEEVSHHLFFICTTNCFYAFVLLFSCTCVRICAFVLTIVYIFNSIQLIHPSNFYFRFGINSSIRIKLVLFIGRQSKRYTYFFCFILNCNFFPFDYQFLMLFYIFRHS